MSVLMPAGQESEGGEQETLAVMPKRLVAVRGPITRRTAILVVNRLVYLAAEDPRAPVPMEINSPGGPMSLSSRILKVMERVACPIATFCRGEVRGAALILAASGLRGFRAAAPECRFSFSSKWREAKDGWVPEQVRQMLLDAVRDPAPLAGWLETGAEFGPEQALKCGLIDSISAKPVFPRKKPAAAKGGTSLG